MNISASSACFYLHYCHISIIASSVIYLNEKMRFDRELTGNSRESSNFLPFHHPSFCFLWTVFLYFFIFHYPHYASQKTDLDLLFHKLASNVCVQTTRSARLVGSCSQSLQTSDLHLLIYAPLCGAECFSPERGIKKEGHPTR